MPSITGTGTGAPGGGEKNWDNHRYTTDYESPPPSDYDDSEEEQDREDIRRQVRTEALQEQKLSLITKIRQAQREEARAEVLQLRATKQLEKEMERYHNNLRKVARYAQNSADARLDATRALLMSSMRRIHDNNLTAVAQQAMRNNDEDETDDVDDQNAAQNISKDTNLKKKD